MPAALASPWVRQEVDTALGEHVAGRMLGVLPLTMQRCNEGTIPLLWRPLTRYDATQEYESARDRLRWAMGLAVPSAPIPRPPTHIPHAQLLSFWNYSPKLEKP